MAENKHNLKKIGESFGAFAFFDYLCPRRAK